MTQQTLKSIALVSLVSATALAWPAGKEKPPCPVNNASCGANHPREQKKPVQLTEEEKEEALKEKQAQQQLEVDRMGSNYCPAC